MARVLSAWAWLEARLGGRREEGVSRAAMAVTVLAHLGLIAIVTLALDLERTPVGGGATAVTLVPGLPGKGDASEAPTAAAATPASAGAAAPSAVGETADARLDALLRAAAQSAPPPTPSSSPTAPSPRGGSVLDRLFGPQATPPPPGQGTSRAAGPAQAARGGKAAPMHGLGPGESLGGVDLYAAASLPPVGQRPAAPAGDLWHRIEPCWRPAGHAPVELVVALGPGGQLLGDPMALRRRDAGPDAALAERAAARATQACAPFTGLAAGKWRVGFASGS